MELFFDPPFYAPTTVTRVDRAQRPGGSVKTSLRTYVNNNTHVTTDEFDVINLVYEHMRYCCLVEM